MKRPKKQVNKERMSYEVVFRSVPHESMREDLVTRRGGFTLLFVGWGTE